MKLKHVKLFEEISQQLVNRAANIAIDRSEQSKDNPLLRNKYHNQMSKFDNYVNPEIKKKLNEAGFGYHEGNVITWKKDMIVELAADATILVNVYSNKYDINKGDISFMSENTQRRLMRAIQYVQNYIKGETK